MKHQTFLETQGGPQIIPREMRNAAEYASSLIRPGESHSTARGHRFLFRFCATGIIILIWTISL